MCVIVIKDMSECACVVIRVDDSLPSFVPVSSFDDAELEQEIVELDFVVLVYAVCVEDVIIRVEKREEGM